VLFALPPAVSAGEYVRLPTRAHVVALTLDAGSDADGAATVLRTLREKQAPATFFLTGRFVRTYPRLAKAIGALGDPVGNHSFDHPHFTSLPTDAVFREVTEAQAEIEKVTGKSPKPLFRFPYGDRDARTLRIVHRLGYVSVRWTVDTLGWMPWQTPAGAARRVIGHLVPGEIVLLHLGERTDAAALPAIIDGVRRRGYRLVTLESLSR
jgi:peptidoglycan/xylan/chitin deacetylase (PgdA/CDA1 family)